jgi:hypothetical protein
MQLGAYLVKAFEHKEAGLGGKPGKRRSESLPGKDAEKGLTRCDNIIL